MKKVRLSFSGRVDAKLDDDAAWKLTQALAVLDALAKDGHIEFKKGRVVTRTKKDEEPKPFKPSPQQQKILTFLEGKDWMTARDMSDSLDIPRNSFYPHLKLLTDKGLLERESRETGVWNNITRSTGEWFYRMVQ